jgi:hypothetical protein
VPDPWRVTLDIYWFRLDGYSFVLYLGDISMSSLFMKFLGDMKLSSVQCGSPPPPNFFV